MTTPKRNEAVAPFVKPAVFHVRVEDKGQVSPSTGFPSYRAVAAVTLEEHEQCVAALQGEVSRLREVLDRVERCAYPVCTSIDSRGYRWSEAYLDQVLPDILNLEPPTDGR